MEARKRYDRWPAVIPVPRQVVQLQVGELTTDVEVTERMTLDRETFTISLRNGMRLYITPNASEVGMADKANNRKPYWRICGPGSPKEEDEIAQIFFLD
jgi:hypothetical protein